MNQRKISKILYIVVAALLLLCLADMPYGFYSLVRFVSAAAFCYLAYICFKEGETDRMIAMVVLAVLFQPLLKISLGRTIWNIIDILVAIYMLYLALKGVKMSKK